MISICRSCLADRINGGGGSMSIRLTQFLLGGLLLAVLAPRVLTAQTTTSGGLTGVVTDQSGAVLLHAVVEIKNDRKGYIRSTTTNRGGVYRFFFLAPSSYAVTVTHEGFRKESRAVYVSLGPPGTLNVAVQIAKTSTEVTVTGE